jgi:Domain of unknown function (DUF4627)
MKRTKVYIIFFLAVSLCIKAQTNLIKNSNMSGLNLNYIGANLTTTVPSPAIGMTGWAGYYGSLKPLNITFVFDDSAHKDAIKLTATGPLLNIQDNPRLVQRIKCPAGVYRLTFWAKSTNSIEAKLAVSVRSTGNNVPAYLINGYENDGTNNISPVHKLIFLTQQWKQYSVDFNLNKTVDSFKLPTGEPLLLSDTHGMQYPVICFNLVQAKDINGSEIMVTDVNFFLKL